ncbi:MAG: ATP-grasp domain-containing protein, partial [Flavobacteriaceae bacterium]
IAVKVAENLQITGLLAVELFLDQNDRILVNEVAPRPHNSGHYSIEASYTNQFEQHLRAILGLPLGNTDSKAIGIMVNLVGAEGYEGPVLYENIEQVMKLEGVTVHIYGKSQTRPFRKMGHVTVVDQARESAYEKAKKVKETLIVKSNG